jgi:hypothetical protein
LTHRSFAGSPRSVAAQRRRRGQLQFPSIDMPRRDGNDKSDLFSKASGFAMPQAFFARSPT